MRLPVFFIPQVSLDFHETGVDVDGFSEVLTLHGFSTLFNGFIEEFRESDMEPPITPIESLSIHPYHLLSY